MLTDLRDKCVMKKSILSFILEKTKLLSSRSKLKQIDYMVLEMIGSLGLTNAELPHDFRLMKNAFEELSCFQRALMEYAGSADPVYAKQHDELSVGLEGSFGSHHVSPRTLTSKFLGSVVCVEGIVTKCKFCLYDSPRK